MAGNGRGKVLGTSSKYDKGLSVLDQYDLTSEHTYRGRGTLLCMTQDGLKMIKPHTGSARRLQKMNEILEHLQKTEQMQMDLVLENKEGELISTDKDGYSYLVKHWWDAKECDVRQETDILRCMEKLARVHKSLKDFTPEEAETPCSDLAEEYEKHLRQMKKIRTYIRGRKQKQTFEYCYLESVERYLSYADAAIQRLQDPGIRRELEIRSICHGMCNQHNFLLTEQELHLVNFDHFFLGNPTADVAQFLRKIMEKHNWNTGLAVKMLDAYDDLYPISKDRWTLLGIRMSYPEKYWKIANYYYNNHKSFLPEKNLEKLQTMLRQERKWLEFLSELFGIVP